MTRPLAAVLFALLGCLATPALGAAPLTLERIMADPDWIGSPVERATWSLDGRSVCYSLERARSEIRDLHRVTLADGRDRIVTDRERAAIDGADPVFDRARRRAAFVRNGDLFVRAFPNGRLTQLTRTATPESAPQFSADGARLQFRSGDEWWCHDFGTGMTAPAALLTAASDPAERKLTELERRQLRLIATLQSERDRRQELERRAVELRRADSTRVPPPVYLGDDLQILDSALSPAGDWMLAVTGPKGGEAGRLGKIARYVTESGYEETEDSRPRVGRNDPAPQTLWRIDLERGTAERLAVAALPGITDDPLAAVRAENARARLARGDTATADTAAHAPGRERGLRIAAIQFAPDGATAAVQFEAIDHKDRWLTTVTRAARALAIQHRLSDSAWVSWGFDDFGWLPDSKRLWYLSEESGWSQLYLKPLDGPSRALTQGRFELSSPALSPDGRWCYALANAEAPYAYDVYRVATGGGALERVTTLRDVERFVLSPDGTRLLLEHSSSYVPTQLAIAPAAGGAARELTDTRTAGYRAWTWPAPRIVAVPSSHVTAPIWSKFYQPPDSAAGLRPIVLFVHGAGYLQNTDLRFPYYFREQMFHVLLARRGYLVLDMDYRASRGYGRDWRTAIYRRMGTPELEDLIDGVQWLVREHHGDPRRVGIYGGSYGGFMTLMAMFRAPAVFRAGAALRPVTDWAEYNHPYTSSILNTPQLDDVAYRRSSPIEFADGLQGSLLICHGMLDDNVLFQDSVRLLQRLIELHKPDVELAPYPLERHAFEHADSWLDEYRRIERLFETRLR